MLSRVLWPARLRPRLLVTLIGIALVAIAILTFRYPPDYLDLAEVWGAATALAGVSCLIAAATASRAATTAAGTFTVTICLIRGVANLESVLGQRTAQAQTSLLIMGLVWLLLALCLWVAWTERVLPWRVLSRMDDE